MPRRRHATPALLALSAIMLAGCSQSSPAAIEAAALTDETANDPIEPIGPGSTMTVESFEWGYEVVEGYAVDGGVEVTLDNIGEAEHNFRIDGAAGETVKVEASGGSTETNTLQLFGAPGGQEYTFYCDIPGHRAQGMEGALLVYSEVDEAEESPVRPEDTTETAGGA